MLQLSPMAGSGDKTESLNALTVPLLSVLAIAALLLPLVGPLLDHHFTERQPGHSHVYLGPIQTGHVHPYEDTRSFQRHSDHHAWPGSQYSADFGQSDNAPYSVIVFLANRHGHSPAYQTLATPTLPKSPVFPSLGQAHFILGSNPAEAVLRGVSVPRPKKPPRV